MRRLICRPLPELVLLALWSSGWPDPAAFSGAQRNPMGNRWTAPSISRRIHFVPPSVVPGLKTRRLDRLSAWALVASSLAIQDAGIDLSQVDRSRVAVVFATGFGCVELTESFFQSAAVNGWSGTDPITFPETLSNAPASHVALFHGCAGRISRSTARSSRGNAR